MSLFLKEEFNSFLPAEYKSAIIDSAQIAEKYGIKIYLIGGIVRDLILKNPIKDIDITVESDAIDFCRLLEKECNCKIISIQENLRTAKVKFENNIEIDFASTREEKYQTGGVLPSAHNFGCKLEQDVKRRDFTINTLALDLTGNNKYMFVDYYNGFEDIKNKKIKILHDKSFIDDPSRIIRALKFQIRFDFEFEAKTKNLMDNYLKNIDKSIPLERIKNELRQYFSIKKDNLYKNIIETKAYKLITNNPITEFNSKALNNIASYNLFNQEDLWFIYIILLLVNEPLLEERLNMTAFEKKVITEVKELLKNAPLDINDKKLIYNTFENKIDLSIAAYYSITEDKSVKKFLDALKQIKVLITGNDLINLGFIPSPYFNELFEKILTEKLDGKLTTKEEELTFVKQFIKKEE